MRRPTVAIVGVGMIGGSLGMAWRKSGAARVIGVARRPETILEALALGAIDDGTTDLAKGVSGADVVVLCTPVLDIVSLARAAISHMRSGAVLTDVGSTKSWIAREVGSLLPADLVFIGGHPMAGSERTGVGAADAHLFEEAIYCLTPPIGSRDGKRQLELVLGLVQALGARALMLDPDVHDTIVAGVSHVPHVVAAALVNAVGAATTAEMPMLQLAAGGFRDTTRIAAGPSDVWRDICLTNKDAILHMLQRLHVALAEIQQAVQREDSEALVRLFDAARATRSAIRSPKQASAVQRANPPPKHR